MVTGGDGVGWGVVRVVRAARSYTCHSMRVGDRALCPFEVCTADEGDRLVLLWVSVEGDTRPGGVEDS